MARDFKADQILTSQIISSGGINHPSASKGLGLIVYSASISTDSDGGFTHSLLRDVGSDVFTFFSGSKDSKISRGEAGNGDAGVVLFGGDVVFSGTMYAERMVVEVDQSTTGSILVSGSIFVSQSATILGTKLIGTSDPVWHRAGLHFSNTTRVQSIIWDENDAAIWESGGDLHLSSSEKTLILSGGSASSINPTSFTDVNFFVSGSGGSRGTSDSGTTAFGGDSVISGSLFVSGNQGPGLTYSGGSISGSIHRTALGESYIVGGTNITVASSSNGQLTISSVGGSSEWTDVGNWLRPGDGASEAVGIGATTNNEKDYPLFLSATGKITTNNFVTASLGFSGSLTRLVDGTAYLIGGTGIAIATGSKGEVTITTEAPVGDITSVVAGTGLAGGGNSGAVTLTINDSAVATITGSQFRGNVGITGSLNVKIEGSAPRTGISIQQMPLGPQVLILSGGGASSFKESNYIDLAFFVSGSAGSRGRNRHGAAIFGGDTIISGTLFVSGAQRPGLGYSGGSISGSIHHTAIGKSYLEAGSNVTIVSSSNGTVKISSTGGTSEWTDTGGLLHPAGSSGAQTVIIGNTGVANADIVLAADGGATFNKQLESVDFRVGSNTKFAALMVDGTTDKVLILSGGAATSANRAIGTDISMFISGTDSGTGTGNFKRFSGVTVVDGDTVVSGGLYLGARVYSEGDHDTYIRPRDDEWQFFAGGKNLLQLSEAESTISFNNDNDQINTVIKTDTKMAIAAGTPLGAGQDQVLIMSGGGATSFNEAAAADVLFYVSGSIGSVGGPTSRGTSVFGGDLVVSGAFKADGSTFVVDNIANRVGIGTPIPSFTLDVQATTIPQIRSANIQNNSAGGVIRLANTRGGNNGVVDDFAGGVQFYAQDSATNETEYAKISSNIVSPTNGAEIGSLTFETATGLANKGTPLFIRGDRVHILSGGAPGSIDESAGADASFYVSGSIGSRSTLTRGTAVFGGDVTVSGSFTSAGQIHITHHSFNSTHVTNRIYIPFAATADYSGTTVRYQNAWVTPFSGRLIKFMIRPYLDMSSQGMTGSIHVSLNGDNQVSTTPTESVEKTITVGANSTTTFAFTGSNHFGAGDWVAVAYWAPYGSGVGANGCNVTCVWELDTTS